MKTKNTSKFLIDLQWFADPVVLKEPKDLEKFANETAEKLESVDEIKATVTAQAEELEAEKAKSAEFEQRMEVLTDKLASVQQMVHAKFGAEKENTDEGKAYRMGLMVKSMVSGKTGGEKEKREAAQVMARLKAFPTSSVPSDKGESFDIRPEYKEMAQKAALSSDPLTSDGSDDSSFYGQYTVPTDLIADLQRIAGDSSAMMNLVTHYPVRGITTYIPNTTDSMTFTAQTDQETAFTEDTFTFGRSTLTVVTYAFWLALTEAMDEDSLIGIGNLIRTMAGEAWGSKFDTLALSDSTYGAINTTGVNALSLGTGNTAFSDLTVDAMSLMPNELNTQTKRDGARFFLHPTSWDYPENERDANGAYMLRQPADGAPYRLRGYPVTTTQGMPSTSAVSTKFVAFGNPKHIVAGDKVGFEFRIYDQTESSMKYGQIFLRARVRQAMVTTVPSAFVTQATAAE